MDGVGTLRIRRGIFDAILTQQRFPCGQQAGSPPGSREQQVGCERWEGALPQRPEDIAPLLLLAGPLSCLGFIPHIRSHGKAVVTERQEKPHIPGSHVITSKDLSAPHDPAF